MHLRSRLVYVSRIPSGSMEIAIKWQVSNHHWNYVINLLTLWIKVFLKKLIFALLVKNSPTFMEPDRSLPCWHDSAAGTYPWTNKCSPHLTTYLTPILISQSNLIFVLVTYLFTLSSPTEILYPSLLSYVLHVPPISSYLVSSPKLYLVNRTDYEPPQVDPNVIIHKRYVKLEMHT